jgi:hypothetical protein
MVPNNDVLVHVLPIPLVTVHIVCCVSNVKGRADQVHLGFWLGWGVLVRSWSSMERELVEDFAARQISNSKSPKNPRNKTKNHNQNPTQPSKENKQKKKKTNKK